MSAKTPIKIVKRALWRPSWYKLDQSIGVGQFGRFAFETGASERTSWGEPFDLVFFNRLLGPERSPEYRFARVLEITHPVLGSIERVDTSGLDYIFYPANGSEVVVNAEEEPGVVYDYENVVADWDLMVVLDDISEPIRDAF